MADYGCRLRHFGAALVATAVRIGTDNPRTASTVLAMTRLTTHVEKYLAVRTKIRSLKTHDHYRRSIRQFAAYLGREPLLADLTDDNLSGFLLATVQAGFCEQTANQRTKQLRALWTWLAKRRLVDQFPTFDDLQEPEPLPEAWTDQQLHQLFAACANQRGWIGPHLASTWWLAIHWWWLSTAERTEATMHLERSMLRLDDHMAIVPARIRKGRKKHRHYRLTPRCCELLGQMIMVPSATGLVFDSHWRDWHSIYPAYRRLIKASGLPYVRGKSGPKKLRCSVYTRIEMAGGDASKFARHSDRRVTDAYLDQLMIGAQNAGQWPPVGFDPEREPSWRNLWGRLY